MDTYTYTEGISNNINKTQITGWKKQPKKIWISTKKIIELQKQIIQKYFSKPIDFEEYNIKPVEKEKFKSIFFKCITSETIKEARQNRIQKFFSNLKQKEMQLPKEKIVPEIVNGFDIYSYYTHPNTSKMREYTKISEYHNIQGIMQKYMQKQEKEQKKMQEKNTRYIMKKEEIERIQRKIKQEILGIKQNIASLSIKKEDRINLKTILNAKIEVDSITKRYLPQPEKENKKKIKRISRKRKRYIIKPEQKEEMQEKIERAIIKIKEQLAIMRLTKEERLQMEKQLERIVNIRLETGKRGIQNTKNNQNEKKEEVNKMDYEKYMNGVLDGQLNEALKTTDEDLARKEEKRQQLKNELVEKIISYKEKGKEELVKRISKEKEKLKKLEENMKLVNEGKNAIEYDNEEYNKASEEYNKILVQLEELKQGAGENSQVYQTASLILKEKQIGLEEEQKKAREELLTQYMDIDDKIKENNKIEEAINQKYDEFSRKIEMEINLINPDNEEEYEKVSLMIAGLPILKPKKEEKEQSDESKENVITDDKNNNESTAMIKPGKISMFIQKIKSIAKNIFNKESKKMPEPNSKNNLEPNPENSEEPATKKYRDSLGKEYKNEEETMAKENSESQEEPRTKENTKSEEELVAEKYRKAFKERDNKELERVALKYVEVLHSKGYTKEEIKGIIDQEEINAMMESMKEESVNMQMEI